MPRRHLANVPRMERIQPSKPVTLVAVAVTVAAIQFEMENKMPHAKDPERYHQKQPQRAWETEIPLRWKGQRRCGFWMRSWKSWRS